MTAFQLTSAVQRVRKAAKFLEGRGTCLSSNQVCC